MFDQWSATGGVSITNPNAQSTTATVCGNGTLTAYFRDDGGEGGTWGLCCSQTQDGFSPFRLTRIWFDMRLENPNPNDVTYLMPSNIRLERISFRRLALANTLLRVGWII